jgi:hypothetical protein
LKRAFNLLLAIFIILLISGLGILTMRYVKISATHFADSFVKEQGLLFKDSVIEATLLKIEGTDRSKECKNRFNFISADNRYEANVTILKYFLYQGRDNDGKQYCTNVVEINTTESHGYVLMEVNVSTREGARVQNPIHIYQRSLQRP